MSDLRTQERKLERELARLTKQAARFADVRFRMPAGSPRSRVTTANAKWARAAEARDRTARELASVRELIARETVAL